jgi:hypothetical protein
MQSNSASKTEVKKRIERYLEALKAVSQQDPDSFAEIAPELIQRSTLNWRGSDPFFANSLNEWLNLDMMWTPFTDIIPKDAHITKRIEDNAFDIKMYSGAIKSLLQALEERFPTDYNQWDATIRNQFIILGMIAMGRRERRVPRAASQPFRPRLWRSEIERIECNPCSKNRSRTSGKGQQSRSLRKSDWQRRRTCSSY